MLSIRMNLNTSSIQSGWSQAHTISKTNCQKGQTISAPKITYSLEKSQCSLLVWPKNSLIRPPNIAYFVLKFTYPFPKYYSFATNTFSLATKYIFLQFFLAQLPHGAENDSHFGTKSSSINT